MPSPTTAGESHDEDNPAPDSVEDYEAPLDQQFEEKPVIPVLFPRLKDSLKGLPHFIEDTKLEVHFRTYYFYEKELDNSRKEAWTYGGQLVYQSGWIRDRVSVGAALYTSQPIHAPSDRDGTLLLRSEQRAYTVVGETYAKIKLAPQHELSLYRQVYDLPYLNKNDGRMTPNTFEGYSLRGELKRNGEFPRLRYIGGYVSRMKKRNSDRFISMGEAAGAIGDPKRGLAMGGALFEPTKGFSLGAISYLVPDVFNTFYSAADGVWHLSDELKLRTIFQYTDQRSVGDDLLTGSSFDTHLVTGRAALSYRSAILRLAFSTTGREESIRGPYGSKPSPLSIMINDFDRAEEDAWLIGASYNFRRLGLEELSAFVNFASGNGGRDPSTGETLPDRNELNLTADYRFERGRFRGLWFRVRGAFVHERRGDTQNQLRIIVRYDFPLL